MDKQPAEKLTSPPPLQPIRRKTLEVTRPMTLPEAEKPSLSAIIEPMVDEMRKQISRRSEKT